MLKLFGSLIIGAASIGFSINLCGEMRAHLMLLYGIRKMFTDLFHEACYSLQPVEIVLRGCDKRWDERLGPICSELAERLCAKQGEMGEEIWRQTFFNHRQSLLLTAEETEVIASAGSAFFGKSKEENEHNYRLCMERLEFIIENARGEQKEKQKVCRTVSITCGLMLIILLI